MAAQQDVSREILASRIGTTIDVIVDEVDEDGALARSKWDAPEIDGSVFLNGERALKPGDIVKARVDAADDYDLWATVAEKP
jgi:ribosomal protein S12 methylthiotransferase